MHFDVFHIFSERKKLLQMPDNNRNNPQRRNDQYDRNSQYRNQYSNEQPAANSGLSSTVKGIIAIMLTLLVVVIIIMVFAKSLFINDNSQPKKTGVVTSTEYIPPATTTTEETEKTTKKTTENSDDSESDIYDDDDEDSQTITCTSAVYLHPEPTSSSANLLTIPSGAECKFFRNENGWYFVEYNGTQGYAWNTFFTSPQE